MTFSDRRGHTAATVAWVGVLLGAAVLLAITKYTTRDPDSALYATMSARMSVRALATWVAPEWEGSWGMTGLFREHPIGIFVLPALLARAGYPALQAAFVVGAVFSILAVLLIRPVAARLVKPHEATALQWAALVLPIAFVYRIRANQEYLVLVFTLAALVATDRTRRQPLWIAAVVAAAVALTLVKGIFAVFLFGVCGLWLMLIPSASPDDAAHDDGRSSTVIAWVGLALAAVAVVLVALGYEQLYRQATGESFLDFYVWMRVGENAGLVEAKEPFSVWARLSNLPWYGVRLLWFAIPGSVVLFASIGRVTRANAARLRGVWWALASTAGYVCAMSVGANRADRFIFPAYFLTGLAGAAVAMRRWPAVDQFAMRLAALPPYALAVAWLALFVLTLITA